VPATDEPLASQPASAFPSVQPAVAPKPAPKAPPTKSAATPMPDPLAEQLAASVLQNQQLQATVDELNAKLQAQNEQIAGEKKQVSELRTRLAEVRQAVAKPVVPAPVVVEEPETNWLLILGLPALLALVLLGWFLRRRRHHLQAFSEPSAKHEPVLSRTVEPLRPASPMTAHRDETPAGDVLEGVAVYLAYGRFDEAVGLLREAMVKEPDRADLAVQLLEVLGKQGDVVTYDAQEAKLRTPVSMDKNSRMPALAMRNLTPWPGPCCRCCCLATATISVESG
jgi:pilus assembly protein FimV